MQHVFPALARPQPARGQKAPPVPALGEILIERELVTPEQLRTAIDRHWRTRRRLGRVLVELGYVTADTVLEALSAQLGLPSTRVDSYTVNPEAVMMLPEKVARQHVAFPLLKVGNTLVVAIASPKNLHALDDLRFASGCGIQTMVALETEILDALDRYYGDQWVPNDQDEGSSVVIDLPGLQLDLHDEVHERSAVASPAAGPVEPFSPRCSRWDAPSPGRMCPPVALLLPPCARIIPPACRHLPVRRRILVLLCQIVKPRQSEPDKVVLASLGSPLRYIPSAGSFSQRARCT